MPQLNEMLDDLLLNPPASRRDVLELESVLGVSLPDDYKAILQQSNGIEGRLPGGSSIILWSTAEVVQQNTLEGTKDIFGDLMLIGTDGGGEVFAIDRRSGKPTYIQTTFVGGLSDVEYRSDDIWGLFPAITRWTKS